MLSKGQRENRCPVMYRVYYRDAARHYGHCGFGLEGRAAGEGTKTLLLLGFGVLPIRGALYTLTHAVGALIAIQTLDRSGECIFGIVRSWLSKTGLRGRAASMWLRITCDHGCIGAAGAQQSVRVISIFGTERPFWA